MSAVPAAFTPALLLPRHWRTWGLIGLIRAAAWLPRPAALVIGTRLGRTFHDSNAKRRRIARINIDLCFPELAENDRTELVRRHFEAYGRNVIDLGLAWHASPRRLDRLCRVEGAGIVSALLAADRPVIAVTPHAMGMDLAGLMLSRLHPAVSMMKAAPDPLLTWRLWRGRTRFGGEVYLRDQGLRPLIRALRQRKVLYYIPDEDFGPERSVFAPFFGVPAATLPVLGRMAAMTGAAVVPCFAPMQADGSYRIVLHEALGNFPSGDDVVDATTMNAALERGVRMAPEQYFWTLRWFRTRPDGGPSPYD